MSHRQSTNFSVVNYGSSLRSRVVRHCGLVAIRRKKSESLHQLIALGDGDVAVVQLPGRLAVHVEPPVALEDGLVEQRRFRTQETLHHQSVVCEGTHVEHLHRKRPFNLKASTCNDDLHIL